MEFTATVVASEKSFGVGVVWLNVPGHGAEAGDLITPTGTSNFPEINGRTFVAQEYGSIADDGTAQVNDPDWIGVGFISDTGPAVYTAPDTGIVTIVREDQPEENDMFTPTSVATKVQNVFPPRAAMYIHDAESGTIDLKREFKGFGALQAYSVPLGTEVTAHLLPSDGPRADGHPLRAQLTVDSTTDVVVFEL